MPTKVRLAVPGVPMPPISESVTVKLNTDPLLFSRNLNV